MKSCRLLIVVTVLLVLSLSGCKLLEALRANISEVGAGLKTSAAVVAGTPLAPIAPILAVAGSLLGALGIVLKRRQTGKGVISEMEVDKVMVFKKKNLLDSRKTKLQAIAIILYGVIVFASIQWPQVVTNQIAGVLIAGIGWVTGKNIEGIAIEDAAEKAKPADAVVATNPN